MAHGPVRNISTNKGFMTMQAASTCLLFSLLMLLAACTSMEPRDAPPEQDIDASVIPDAVPRHEPLSKQGNPDSYVIAGQRYYVMRNATGHRDEGLASWYGSKFHGRLTSNGERYDMFAMTAAHKTLPLPSYVKVTNLENQRSVIVRVNDRGPFHGDRIIDLSYVAAKKLDMLSNGTARVRMEVITADTLGDSMDTGKANYSNRYYLQVGAFSKQENALNMLTELKSQNLGSAMVTTGSKNGNHLYHVRLGPFDDQNTIISTKNRLRQLGLENSFIVRE